jgi:toxin ParE1/3/4
MKSYHVTFRKTAQRDLKAVFDYVLERSGSRQTALQYTRRLRARCGNICDAPFGGVARPELGPDLRMAVFERSIVILYIVQDDRVRITNIFSGGQDYEALLRSDR